MRCLPPVASRLAGLLVFASLLGCSDGTTSSTGPSSGGSGGQVLWGGGAPSADAGSSPRGNAAGSGGASNAGAGQSGGSGGPSSGTGAVSSGVSSGGTSATGGRSSNVVPWPAGSRETSPFPGRSASGNPYSLRMRRPQARLRQGGPRVSLAARAMRPLAGDPAGRAMRRHLRLRAGPRVHVELCRSAALSMRTVL